MFSPQVFSVAPFNNGYNNGYYAVNTNLLNGYNPQLHPCQLQTYPVQYVIPPSFCPVQQYPLNTLPFCSAPPSPVQYQSQTQFIPLLATPSPSPPRYDVGMNVKIQPQPIMVGSQVSSSCMSSTGGGAGSAGSQSSDGNSMPLREFYSFNIVKQKASILDMVTRYEQGLAKAMRTSLQTPSVEFSIHLIPSKKNKNITIQWIVNQEKFDFAGLKRRTLRRDFQKKLICELAKIDNGTFNTYLSGAKQLTIINEGWSCLLKLKNILISRNGTLDRLLAVPEEDRFEEEAIKNLYKVSQDEQGKALRGPTVVGVRFKLQSDILKMPEFVESIKACVGISRATMIASLKTHKQYKGWSVYLDVGTEKNVERVEDIAQKFGFEKTKVFVAEDTF